MAATPQHPTKVRAALVRLLKIAAREHRKDVLDFFIADSQSVFTGLTMEDLQVIKKTSGTTSEWLMLRW
jgi:hypothetical protein